MDSHTNNHFQMINKELHPCFSGNDALPDIGPHKVNMAIYLKRFSYFMATLEKTEVHMKSNTQLKIKLWNEMEVKKKFLLDDVREMCGILYRLNAMDVASKRRMANRERAKATKRKAVKEMTPEELKIHLEKRRLQQKEYDRNVYLKKKAGIYMPRRRRLPSEIIDEAGSRKISLQDYIASFSTTLTAEEELEMSMYDLPDERGGSPILVNIETATKNADPLNLNTTEIATKNAKPLDMPELTTTVDGPIHYVISKDSNIVNLLNLNLGDKTVISNFKVAEIEPSGVTPADESDGWETEELSLTVSNIISSEALATDEKIEIICDMELPVINVDITDFSSEDVIEKVNKCYAHLTLQDKENIPIVPKEMSDYDMVHPPENWYTEMTQWLDNVKYAV